MDDFVDSDAYQITWLIRRLFRSMGRRAEEALRDLGISAADRAVLEFLYPDVELSVPGIASRYSVSRQHVQVTVNTLLGAGLVTTKRNPRHKRSALIKLTARGRRLFARIRAVDAELIEWLFAGVSVRDRGQTRRTLETLYETLQEGEQP